MTNENSIVGWVIAGGGGTIIGSLVMSVVQTLGKRGVERATAADLGTTVLSRAAQRLEAENLQMRADVAQMRKALVLIADTLDKVIDDLPVDIPQKNDLKSVTTAARMAIIPTRSEDAEELNH